MDSKWPIFIPITGCSEAAKSTDFWNQPIVTTLIDKGILALVGGIALAGAAYWFSKKLETHKGQLAFHNEIAEKRADAYARLWENTKDLDSKDAVEKLSQDQLQQKRSDLEHRYYDNGGAMYLSLSSVEFLLSGLRALEHRKGPKKIVDNFSTLRTQLKIDMGSYTKEEAQTEIRTSGLSSFHIPPRSLD